MSRVATAKKATNLKLVKIPTKQPQQKAIKRGRPPNKAKAKKTAAKKVKKPVKKAKTVAKKPTSVVSLNWGKQMAWLKKAAKNLKMTTKNLMKIATEDYIQRNGHDNENDGA